MSDNLHILAGAYTLDALPSDEHAFFERHLPQCETCRHDVGGFREATASMGMAAAEHPPSMMRARVLAGAACTRQTSPLPRLRPSVRQWLHPHLTAVAIAVAAAAISLAGATVYLSEAHEATRPVAMSEQFLAVADVVKLDAPDGTRARFFYSSEHDRGYVAVTGLPALDAGRDYQLWLFHEGVPVPAGVFDAPDGSIMVPVEASVRDAEMIAVTTEPAGGRSAPSGAVVLTADIEDGSDGASARG